MQTTTPDGFDPQANKHIEDVADLIAHARRVSSEDDVLKNTLLQEVVLNFITDNMRKGGDSDG